MMLFHSKQRKRDLIYNIVFDGIDKNVNGDILDSNLVINIPKKGQRLTDVVSHTGFHEPGEIRLTFTSKPIGIKLEAGHGSYNAIISHTSLKAFNNGARKYMLITGINNKDLIGCPFQLIKYLLKTSECPITLRCILQQKTADYNSDGKPLLSQSKSVSDINYPKKCRSRRSASFPRHELRMDDDPFISHKSIIFGASTLKEIDDGYVSYDWLYLILRRAGLNLYEIRAALMLYNYQKTMETKVEMEKLNEDENPFLVCIPNIASYKSLNIPVCNRKHISPSINVHTNVCGGNPKIVSDEWLKAKDLMIAFKNAIQILKRKKKYKQKKKEKQSNVPCISRSISSSISLIDLEMDINEEHLDPGGYIEIYDDETSLSLTERSCDMSSTIPVIHLFDDLYHLLGDEIYISDECTSDSMSDESQTECSTSDMDMDSCANESEVEQTVEEFDDYYSSSSCDENDEYWKYAQSYSYTHECLMTDCIITSIATIVDPICPSLKVKTYDIKEYENMQNKPDRNKDFKNVISEKVSEKYVFRSIADRNAVVGDYNLIVNTFAQSVRNIANGFVNNLNSNNSNCNSFSNLNVYQLLRSKIQK